MPDSIHTRANAAFLPGLSARETHEGLKRALAVFQRAEKNVVLFFAEVLKRKLYRELGYSSIHQYAREALGFASCRTSQFLRLVESLEELPGLKSSVAAGEIPWTKAREVARVATPATEAQWIEEAKRSPRKELERKIARSKERTQAARRSARSSDPAQASLLDTTGACSFPAVDEPSSPALATAAVPLAVSFRLDPVQLARFDTILARLRRLGVRKSREEILLEAMDAYAGVVELETAERKSGANDKPAAVAGEAGCADTVEVGCSDRGEAGCENTGEAGGLKPEATSEIFPRGNAAATDCHESSKQAERQAAGSPYQIILYKCEECGRAELVTSRGRKPVSRTKREQIECDARVQQPDGKTRASIPPATRRKVLARDGHRCQSPGCGSTQFLEVHHRIPRSQGGSNRPENLVTLYSACHQLHHELTTPELAAIDHAKHKADRKPDGESGKKTPSRRRAGAASAR